jgi:hypothetical protein
MCQLDLLVLLLGYGALLAQPLPPLQVVAGIPVTGIGHGFLCFGLFQLEPDRPRVQLGQDLAFPDPVALFDMDAGDLASDNSFSEIFCLRTLKTLT